jgi:hypothetical protein
MPWGLCLKTKLLGVGAALVLFGAVPQASAVTYNYSLNGTYAEDNGNGPSLVSYGGSFAPGGGYNFGLQQGLSLSGTGIYDSYSIAIRFFFNDVNLSPPTCCAPYQRILDFQNRVSDSGLYSHSGNLELFAKTNSGDPSGSSSSQVFHNDILAALRVTRDSSGLFTAYVNGAFLFSAMDNTGSTKFSGPDNIIHFFIDDLESLFYYPDSPEAGTGYIDSISVTVNQTLAVPGPIVGAGLPGIVLAGGGLLAWLRRKKRQVIGIRIESLFKYCTLRRRQETSNILLAAKGRQSWVSFGSLA